MEMCPDTTLKISAAAPLRPMALLWNASSKSKAWDEPQARNMRQS
jgi:hypothetical protein